MSLAAVLPPGTLTVVTRDVTRIFNVSMPALDWNSVDPWVLDSYLPREPSKRVTAIASQTAQNMVVLPLSPPAANASYTLKVRGPFLQCNPANSSQVPYFEDYKESLLEGPLFVTASNWNTPIRSTFRCGDAEMLMFSAFDPSLGGPQGWLGNSYSDETNSNGPDEYNAWAVDFPVNASGYYEVDSDDQADGQVVPRQIWVQTSNESIVCTMGNATRDVTFGFMEGTQTIAYGDLEDFEPVFVPRLMSSPLALNVTAEQFTYVAAYVAMTSMISGNASIQLMPNETSNSSDTIIVDNFSLTFLMDSSSRSLVTGLVACDEFVHSFWQEHPIVSDPVLQCNVLNCSISENGSIQSCPQTPQNWTGPPLGQLAPPETVTNTVFNSPAWMCRNRTLARAMEDLATNITISMMSAPDLM